MLIYYFLIAILLSVAVFVLKNKLVSALAGVVFLIVNLGLMGYGYAHLGEHDTVFFIYDAPALLFSMVLAVLGVTSYFYSLFYHRRAGSEPRHVRIYYSSFIMLIAAITGVYLAENMAVLWVCIEATTMCVAVLIYQERTKSAIEAAWKYLFSASIGVAIAFIGILFISVINPQDNMMHLNFYELMAHAAEINPIWMKVSFLFVVTGVSVKMSTVPLFPASIDAKTIAPTPVNALISTALVNAGFLAVFRFYAIIGQTDSWQWARNVILLVAVLSLLMCAVQMYKVKRYTRLYAFSTMEHISIVLLGMYAGKTAFFAALLHLVMHSFIKAGLFYQIGQIKKIFKSIWFQHTGGLMKIAPAGGAVVIFGFLLITAIPPSGLFVTELVIFKELFAAHHVWVGVGALLLIMSVLYVLAKNIFHLLFAPLPERISAAGTSGPYFSYWPVIVLFVLSIYLGFFTPPFVSDLIRRTIELLN